MKTATSGRRDSRRTALRIALALLVLMLALAAAWHWTPLQEVARPSVISPWLHDAARSPWMPLFIAVLFVGASWVLFPNTVLCLAVILALGPRMGTAYAFAGSMLAAFVGYSIGRWGGQRIEKLRVRAIDRFSGELRRGGFLQVLALRFLPVAPFSATNIVAGVARVHLLPFLAATAVGISPYILTFGLFGRQARRVVTDPSLADAGWGLGLAALALLVAWWTHSRWKRA